MIRLIFYIGLFSLSQIASSGENWPQASGPNANFQVTGVKAPPSEWSVVRNENIRWRTTLPEGGQSAVTIWGDSAFVTTHALIEEGDPLTEPNLIGYCLNANTGEIRWQVELPGTDPVKTAGIFSDGTVFAPVTDGEHVWFFNRCGSMGCFDFDGNQIWLRTYQPRPRHTNRECEPILIDDLIITVEVKNKVAGQEMKRHAPVPQGIDPKDVWTYLHAIEKHTGKVRWIGEAGTAVHNTPMVNRMTDGRLAIVHGRGGGHGPLEKPYGVSLTLADSGKTLWSREMQGDCSFHSYWDSQFVYWFEKMNHHVLDASTGEILRTRNVSEAVDFVDRFESKDRSYIRKKGIDLKVGRKMPLTNQTNIVVGDWHYFLAHDIVAVGRVNTKTGKTEYLRLPIMVLASEDNRGLDSWVWDKKKLRENSTRNSRGIDIAADKRARGSGWGHVSAASPILVNRHLFFPVMNGTVYVIDAFAEVLDEKALVAVNDLGPAYETWTLASFTCSKGRLFMHTMKEVICIGE